MIKLMAATWILFASLSARAGELTAACPRLLDGNALTIRGPEGWAGHASGPMRLTSFGMMAGPPETMSYLVPSESRSTKAGGSSTWEFDAAWQKWLYCRYDGSAAIQISRQLDVRANRCTVRYTKSSGIVSSASVTCLTD